VTGSSLSQLKTLPNPWGLLVFNSLPGNYPPSGLIPQPSVRTAEGRKGCARLERDLGVGVGVPAQRLRALSSVSPRLSAGRYVGSFSIYVTVFF
jgi:hypothetical protein